MSFVYFCSVCKKELTADEFALYRKLVRRDGENCLCYHCLAEQFDLDEEKLPEMAEQFKKQGCMLF
ncbi:MAG: hypothetical protein J6C26_04235 [Clostridia bacterium]|nr:hypothetical protein [Clostridia bacterium]